MSDDKTAILIRALEASGSDREAKLARAILGETPAESLSRAINGDPPAAAPVETQPAAPTLPEGIMSVEQIDAWEKLPRGTYKQQRKTQEQLDQVMASVQYHAEQS